MPVQDGGTLSYPIRRPTWLSTILSSPICTSLQPLTASTPSSTPTLAAGKRAEADAVRAEIARRETDDRIAFEDYTAAVKDAGGPVDETWERRVFEMNAFNPNVGG